MPCGRRQTLGDPWQSCTVTPMAPLRCHPVPSPNPCRSACSLPGPCPSSSLHIPNPGEKSHPPRPCPLAKSNSQFLPSIFFFPMISARLDEQSPLLCLPGLAHILIRSCRYPAVICLVSTFTQTRLANRCVLQLHSLRQAHLRALTGLLSARLLPPSNFQQPADTGAGLGWPGSQDSPSLASQRDF